MIQNVLRHLGGIENYGIISLCLFCATFTIVLIWALLQKNAHLNRMADLPLETETRTEKHWGTKQLPPSLVVFLFFTLAFSL